MPKGRKSEVRREILLVLMVVMLFVSLLVTWTVLSTVETVGQSYRTSNTFSGAVPEEGARVALTIQSEISHEGGSV